MGDNPPMNWNFTKMHGAGNDFVVLDGVRQVIDMTPERARALGDRHFGIGADQILLVERATRPDADFRYRIFNSDGSEVEQLTDDQWEEGGPSWLSQVKKTTSR